MAGAILFAMFHSLFDSAGATVAGVLLLLIGIVLITGKAFVPYVVEYFPKLLKSMKEFNSKKTISSKKTFNRIKDNSLEEKAKQTDERAVQNILPLQPEIEEVVSQPIISAFSERIDKPVRVMSRPQL